MLRKLRAAGVALLVALPSIGAGSAAEGERNLNHGGKSLSLSVMSFNIEWGGANVRFDSVTEAILAAGADIVGVQESEGNLPRLASSLGWHFNLRNNVIARYPLIDPPEAEGRYVLAEVSEGRVIAVANVHLPPSPSGVAWLRAGRTPHQVISLERRVRLGVVTRFLDPLPGLARQGLPVFLTGNFNSPSHEDWVETTVGKFPYRNHTVAWPVSHAVAAAGLRDSYRDIHQDPLASPGFTWWAARQEIRDFNPHDAGLRSRIDFVWFGGPARVTASRLVGEPAAPDVEISIAPWPSDHRAVISHFDIVPAPMPVLVAADKRVHTSGSPLGFVYRNNGAGGSLVIERYDAGVITERRIALKQETGRLQVRDDFLDPGSYQVVLHDRSGDEVSRNDFWIQAAGARPSVTIAGTRFASGEPLPLSWRNMPGNRYDWIGIYELGATEEQEYRAWSYMDTRSSGDVQWSGDIARDGWPLPPGRYVARLLLDDGYTLLAESEAFTVD